MATNTNTESNISTTENSNKGLYTATYQPGEDPNRLAESAKSFGLANARTPLRPVREAPEFSFHSDGNGHGHEDDLSSSLQYRYVSQSMVKFGSMVWKNAGILFSDSTLEAARMHSVGTLAKEERVSRDGTLHLLSVSRRKKGAIQPPSYGDLMDLFHKPVLGREPMEVEVRETEDVEYEEVVVESVEGGTITAAVFGIVKGMVGPAVLYLPRGFAISGWSVAIPAMMVATLSYLYCSTRLLQAWKVESEKTRKMAEKMGEIRKLLDDVNNAVPGTGSSNYGSMSIDEEQRDDSNGNGNVPAPTLLTYPELARRAFGTYSTLISGGIAAMQFGVCLTYLIFVPQNLSQSFRSLGYYVPKQAFLIAMLALEIPLCWIRDIRRLAPFNIVATLLIAFGLASVLYIALFDGKGGEDGLIGGSYYLNTTATATGENEGPVQLGLAEEVARLPSIKDTWLLFVGTSFFCFEGSITLLVPLQEAVYSRADRERFPRVNNQVISSVVLFYMFFAIVCWASFGDKVQTALTASLPQGLLSTFVQVAYSIAVVFTFPLQAFPALEVVMRKKGGKDKVTVTSDKSESATLYKRNFTTSIIICLLGVVAILAIDYLGNVVSLLGSLVGIPIALIYPPLIHNKLVKDSSTMTRMLNYCLSVIGLFAALVASYTTIISWDDTAE
mmetsp:Transcript_7163/g.8290  ORF Transcript_7163/g.8290 Transcript_7163/m.8290 type:complete len:671 (+) Transcript_7163:156-2168(+)